MRKPLGSNPPFILFFTRVQQLLNIESMAKNNQESDFSLDHENVFLKRLESPISSWNNNAFLTRNKSIVNSSSWGDLLQPINEQGWCGDDATSAEFDALQATLLMLPKTSNIGIAWPEFAGASAAQPPQANEFLWLVWLDSTKIPVDWLVLND